MDRKDFEEISVCGKQFRVRKERSFKGSCDLEKKQRQKDFGIDDIIKVDCEIFDSESKQWRKVNDEDLNEISSKEGMKLFKKVQEIRKGDRDFVKTQSKSKKKQNSQSGK